ncbi:MAG: LiaF-related protein, partial [Clostridium sporogenes]|nr:LiaF-related protein [Clostridium sporogenes]
IYNIETFLDKVLSEQELKKNVISKIGKFCFTWNKEHKKKYLTPMEIVKNEMSYRYMDKKYKEAFKSIGVSKDIQWVSIDGTEEILPNPYYYFNDENFCGDLKITCLTSYAHGDFQGDNVIITEEKPIIIDFSDLLKDCNVFHDLRCLEAITLGDYLDIYEVKHRQQWLKVCKSVSQDILKVDIPDGKGMSLLRELMPLLRESLKIIVSDMRNVSYNPSFFVAGVAAGLINMRKFTDIDKKRAAFIYAAYNLKSMLKDKMVNMYKPSLDSCMVFNWVKGNKANKLINLKELNVEMGVGKVDLDISGNYKNNVKVDIQGGVGEATVYLPKSIGVKIKAEKGVGAVNANGFIVEGENIYKNSQYGKSKNSIEVNIEAGVGAINIKQK